MVVDVRPAGGIVLAAPQECEWLVEVYRCPIGTLAAGESRAFVFKLRYPTAGSFLVELHAIAEQDTDPGNDEATVPVTIF